MKKYNFIFLVLFAAIVIFLSEMIGFQIIPIGSKTKIVLLPLVFALLITMVLGLQVIRKGILKKIFSEENINFSSKYLIIIMLPLMAKYGGDIAPKIKDILSIGWIFLIQELGNVGTVLLGLPVALALGLGRAAIGSTLGIGREGELAYISEKYTLNSEEGKGVISIYIFGTLFGALFFSIVAPLFLYVGFKVEALAIASGMGSGSMMVGASSSLVALFPEKAELIRAYAASSQLLTSFIGTFTMIFVAVPLQRYMYKKITGGEK